MMNLEKERIESLQKMVIAKEASVARDFEPHLGETFPKMLVRLIDERKLTDPQTYNKANMTRSHFNKLKNEVCKPSKKSAIALSIALMLDMEEAQKFLKTAGFALSRAILSDVIIEYHISNGIFDIYRINEMLFAYDQETLGA